MANPLVSVLLAARDSQGKRTSNGKPDPVHAYLLDAFTYRIEHALAGHPHAGPL